MKNKSYVINCKGTFIHPNLFNMIMNGEFPVTVPSDIKNAKILYYMSAALPDVPAGVLYDLVNGVREYKVTDDTFEILPLGVKATS